MCPDTCCCCRWQSACVGGAVGPAEVAAAAVPPPAHSGLAIEPAVRAAAAAASPAPLAMDLAGCAPYVPAGAVTSHLQFPVQKPIKARTEHRKTTEPFAPTANRAISMHKRVSKGCLSCETSSRSAVCAKAAPVLFPNSDPRVAPNSKSAQITTVPPTLIVDKAIWMLEIESRACCRVVAGHIALRAVTVARRTRCRIDVRT